MGNDNSNTAGLITIEDSNLFKNKMSDSDLIHDDLLQVEGVLVGFSSTEKDCSQSIHARIFILSLSR